MDNRMARTVIALYDNFSHANAAVRELVDNGISRNDISIMANDESGEYSRYVNQVRETNEPADSGAASGAGVGAGIGAVIGGLGGILIGLGALTIPGIGPVLAAGPLAAAISGLAGAGAGAVAGGITGGLIGALVDMGVPEENAQYFAEGIRRGGTLVTVRTSDDRAALARDILNHHNPVDMNERISQWRASGWAGFNRSEEVGRMEAQTGSTMADRPSEEASRNWNYEQSTSSDFTPAAGYMGFTGYDEGFRTHFAGTSYANTYTYDQYEPAYRYGYDLATNQRYRGRDWTDIEPDARRYWDERNPGTWERIKDAVRYAWEEVKDAVERR